MRCSFFTLLTLAALTAGLTAQQPPAASPSAPAGTPATVVPKLSYSSVHVDGPYIAMTFDDGPSAANTPRLLEMLAKRNIKATFFVVGECAHQYPALLKREIAEGHEIGNHSWSHPNLAKLSESGVHAQLQQTQDAVVAATGVTPKYLRPPYGAIGERQKKTINAQFGYKMILWDVDPLDWKRPGTAAIVQRILTQTHNGSIVLAHDIHKQTVDAMPEVLDGLLAKGFKFVTVSQLLAMEKPGKPKTAPAHGSSASPAASPAIELNKTGEIPGAFPTATPAPAASAH